MLSGTATLAGNNTYTGSTSVAGGKLLLTSGGSLGATAVTVSSGAVFGVSQSANAAVNALGGNLALNAGSSFTMADGFTSTLAVGGNAALGASTFAFDLGGSSTAVDRLAIAGSAAITAANEQIVINPFGSTPLALGSYTLITAGSGSTLATNPLSLSAIKVYLGGSPYALSLTNAAGSVTLNVAAIAGPDQAYWTGAAGTAWNAGLANFNTTLSGGTAVAALPAAGTDVFFTATVAGNLITTPGTATTINSLNFLAGYPLAGGAGGDDRRRQHADHQRRRRGQSRRHQREPQSADHHRPRRPRRIPVLDQQRQRPVDSRRKRDHWRLHPDCRRHGKYHARRHCFGGGRPDGGRTRHDDSFRRQYLHGRNHGRRRRHAGSARHDRQRRRDRRLHRRNAHGKRGRRHCGHIHADRFRRRYDARRRQHLQRRDHGGLRRNAVLVRHHRQRRRDQHRRHVHRGSGRRYLRREHADRLRRDHHARRRQHLQRHHLRQRRDPGLQRQRRHGNAQIVCRLLRRRRGRHPECRELQHRNGDIRSGCRFPRRRQRRLRLLPDERRLADHRAGRSGQQRRGHQPNRRYGREERLVPDHRLGNRLAPHRLERHESQRRPQYLQRHRD